MNFRIIVVLLLFVSSAAVAQTADTGTIAGRVLDGDTPLSSMRIDVTSPALLGARSQMTNADGSYRFALLPPGRYTVTAALDGFSPVRRQNVIVSLGGTVTIDLPIHAASSEQITVTAPAPLLDVTTSEVATNVTAETMQSLPFDRNYVAAAQVAPGAKKDSIGITFNGSTGLENQFVIDGLDVTDALVGSENKPVAFDFVQEVQVLSGGLPAEYGRMTGGMVNAITKSGSNELHASGFAYSTGGRLQAQPSYTDQMPAGITSYSNDEQKFDSGGSVGGYFIRDRLWFFGAYDRVSDRTANVLRTGISAGGYSLPAGTKLPTHSISNDSAAKISAALTSSQTVHLSLFGDPAATEGAVKAVLGPPSTYEGTLKSGGNDLVGHYDAVFSGRWNVSATAGRNVQSGRFTGSGTDTPIFRDRTHVPEIRSGGFGAFADWTADRGDRRVDVSTFFGARQIVKLGSDEEVLSSDKSSFFSGGDRIIKFCSVRLIAGQCPPTGIIYYQHTTNTTDALNPADPSTFAASITNPLTTRYTTRSRSAYVQDSWSVTPNVTLNGGLRIEKQRVNDGRGRRVIDVTNPAPRLGIVWDPSGSSHGKVYAYFGRFFESFTLDMDRDFGGSGGQLSVNNLDPTPGDFTPDPRAPSFAGTRVPYTGFTAGNGFPVDPNIEGQYVDEYLVGYDRDLGRQLVAGFRGTYRNLGRLVEDTATDSTGSQFIMGNPGEGQLATMPFLSGEVVRTPKPIRRYTGLDLHVTKRFDGNSQLFASYVWSRLYGNYEGPFIQSVYQANPNTSIAYDFADLMVNSYGPLSSDRTHQLKFYGAYAVPGGFAHGLVLGLATHWYSGQPLTVMNFGSSTAAAFLTPRGALGRGPADYEADMHAAYPIEARGHRVEMLVDVFNALNRQAPTLLDQWYNDGSAPPCTAIPDTLCSGDGAIRNKPGTTEPIGALVDPRATAVNPHFLKGSAFSGQRTVRIGARLTL